MRSSKTIKSMFNQEQKSEYIEFEKTNKQSLINYFGRLYKSEKIFNKDIVDMNEDEFRETIISLNIRREESRGHLISLLKGYVTWAKLNGKTENENVIDKITPESTGTKKSIVTQMLKSPKQVENILNYAIDNGYDALENRAIRDKLVFWLLYLGMETKELQFLKKDDINYETKIVTTKDEKKYEIDDNILKLWKSCADMTYIEKKGTKSLSGEIHYELVLNDYLFRPIAGLKEHLKNPVMSLSLFATIIIKLFKNYISETQHEIMVSPLNIKLSGIFYKLYLLEQDGIEITPEIIADYIGVEYLNRNELLLKTRKWRIDYNDWKNAFGYCIIYKEK